MSKELKSCEHKQTIVVDNSLAEWCEDCGAFRIKTLNPWRGSEWYYPKTRPVASAVSGSKLAEIIEDELQTNCLKSLLDIGENANYYEATQILARSVYDLLAEGKDSQ